MSDTTGSEFADPVTKELEVLVLCVHRRNGGGLTQIEWAWRLLEPAIGLDSLDLAEIVVAIEKRFRVSPFDTAPPPRTWDDLRHRIVEKLSTS